MAYHGNQNRLAQSEEQEQISLDNAMKMRDDERRMNEYNSRPLPNDWDGALRHQEEERRVAAMQEQNARKAEQMNASRGVLNNYIRSGLQLEKLAMDQMSVRDDHIAAAMKLAGANGGMIPKYMIPGLNNAFGLDGKTAGVYGGGFTKDGSGFFLAIAGTDPNTGRLVPKAVQFDRKQMYDLMLSKPGIFTRGEMQAVRNKYAEDYMKRNPGSEPLPEVPPDYGQIGDVGVGNRTETGGTAVPSSWLYGPRQQGRVSAFGANGRGGFTQYYSGPETGGQLASADFGTRAADDKGRWKQISVGPDPDGDGKRQIRRYENDKTGEVVSVRDGETPPWESRAVGEKERIARINADGKIKAAEKANETKMNLAEAANALKQYGIDVSAQLKERGLDIQQQNADERSAHNQAVESQQAENEKGRNSRAKMANETKTKMAEMKSKGTIGGRLPTIHEYVEALRFANDLLNDEADRNAMREHAKRIEESLKQRGEKIPESPPSGKTGVEPGDNGNGGRTITRGQLDRAVKAGATYDEKTGILKTKDGRTMKVAGIQD